MKKVFIIWVAAMLLAFAGFAAAAVDLNSATAEELDTVKGIGPAKAKAIIDYREKNGPFKSVDDLKDVKGFGEKSLEKMRPELTVGGATAPVPKAAPSAAPAPKVARPAAPAPMSAPAAIPRPPASQ